MWQEAPVLGHFCGARKEYLAKCNQGRPAHEEASTEQDAADTKRSQALNFAISAGEAVGGWLEGPADGREGHDVADEIGETVNGIGDESWNRLV